MSQVSCIGILREERLPRDTRVCLSPLQARQWMETHPDIRLLLQPSPYRCYSDAEYLRQGVRLCEDLSGCDVLLGIKQVPVDRLLPEKTYLMFSHTLKQQPENRGLLQAVLRQRIRLIDYECMTREDGTRLLGFGRFAGIVGAHTGLWALGERSGSYRLPRAYACGSLQGLKSRLRSIHLPQLRVLVTGSGRVAAGACELLDVAGFQHLELRDWPATQLQQPAYALLSGGDLYARSSGGTFRREEFHAHPERYESLLEPYLRQADLLVSGVYWKPGSPSLFRPDSWNPADWKLRTIADVSCDPQGAIPLNMGPSSVQEPVYGVDPGKMIRLDAFDPAGIDLVAVDNLPSELPRDASWQFGSQLLAEVLPALLKTNDAMTQRACIAEHGHLCERFRYLQAFAAPDAA